MIEKHGENLIERFNKEKLNKILGYIKGIIMSDEKKLFQKLT